MNFLILIFLAYANVHDIDAVTFEINQKDQHLELMIEIDAEDLKLLYPNKEMSKLKTKKRNKTFQKYFDQHFELIVDGNGIKFDIQSVSQKKHSYHFLLKSDSLSSKSIEHIQLINTFLISEIKGHTNIIHFTLNNDLRSFRIHKERTEIDFSF